MLLKILLSGFQSETTKSEAAVYHFLSNFHENRNLIEYGKMLSRQIRPRYISRGDYYGGEAITNFEKSLEL